ncbi:MAG: PTS sugar transporter subunit IIB [Anaerolineaceae bacterium]|nr:PTS sugar transporter subunit IIB [Anaerolineaceae bacterium]
MITMLRIDGRLIHGQVIAGFSGRVGANMIMVINDAAAKNAFQKNLMKMAIPAGTALEVLSVEESLVKLNTDAFLQKKILVLVKSPIDLVALIEKGLVIEKVNVGGVINDGAKIKLTKEVMATEEEMVAWKKLNELGLKMELQWESNAIVTDFNNVIARS